MTTAFLILPTWGQALLLCLVFVLGALHRRTFGGWWGVRGALMRPTPALWGLPALLVWWPAGLLLVALSVLHWNDGHRYDRPWKVLLRYGWAPLVLALASGWYWAALLGPAVALADALARIWRLPALWLPWDRVWRNTQGTAIRTRQMIDGWAAWWEGFLGGASALTWVAATMYGEFGPLRWLLRWLVPRIVDLLMDLDAGIIALVST
jgi:hypothetical protein